MNEINSSLIKTNRSYKKKRFIIDFISPSLVSHISDVYL